MSANPVNAWDMMVAAATETTLGTTPAPASTAAYAALAIEAISCNLGPAESGVIRPKQDRNIGRGDTNGFVEGRVMPLPWTLDTSLKSRATATTASHLLALFKAAGMVHTIGGSDVTITPSDQPIEDSAFAGMTLRRWLGTSLACHEMETLRGCVARSLRIEGGAGELITKWAGVGIGKTTATSQAGVQGSCDSLSVADDFTTSITVSAAESYRLGLGYYLWESEIVLLTACTPGGTSATITRGALGSTPAAHSSKPLTPYRPAPTYTGSPIAEAVATVTLGGVATRCRSFSIDIQTGLDLIEPETGSRYSQGAKYGRYSVAVSMQLVLSGDQVSLLGKATARPTLVLAIVQGTGAGGIFTFNAAYCEVVAFTVPDTANDIAIADVQLRVRDDGSGNNAYSIVLT